MHLKYVQPLVHDFDLFLSIWFAQNSFTFIVYVFVTLVHYK